MMCCKDSDRFLCFWTCDGPSCCYKQKEKRVQNKNPKQQKQQLTRSRDQRGLDPGHEEPQTRDVVEVLPELTGENNQSEAETTGNHQTGNGYQNKRGTLWTCWWLLSEGLQTLGQNVFQNNNLSINSITSDQSERSLLGRQQS